MIKKSIQKLTSIMLLNIVLVNETHCRCDGVRKATPSALLRPPLAANDGPGNARHHGHHSPTHFPTTCTRPIEFNTPSISGAIIEQHIVFKRTVTAVLEDKHRYGLVHFDAKATVDAGSSFKVDVWPRSFEVSDGNNVDVYITISYHNTPLSTPQTGQVC
jgi:hypothetical protein